MSEAGKFGRVHPFPHVWPLQGAVMQNTDGEPGLASGATYIWGEGRTRIWGITSLRSHDLERKGSGARAARLSLEGSITFHDSGLPLACVMGNLLSWGGGEGEPLLCRCRSELPPPSGLLGPMTQQSWSAASAHAKQA